MTVKKVSEESKLAAVKVVSANLKSTLCQICLDNGIEKYCSGEKGLNLHLIKSHNIKRK